MSFFDQLHSTWQSAKAEKERIERERLYQQTHLTDADMQAVALVKRLCTDPSLKPKILAAAQSLKNSCELYSGGDLMILGHLNYTTQQQVIQDITTFILEHYGSKFNVTIQDSCDGYGQYNAAGALMNVTFGLSWYHLG